LVEISFDKQLYIVMAFYEGKTLKERIEEGDIPPKDAVDIAIQIARGLFTPDTGEEAVR